MATELKRLFDFPYYQLEKFPQEAALVSKVDGKWEKTSTQEVVNQANLLSKGLLELGVQRGDKIGMISNNRTEWNITDIGILQIGAINVPIYPTITEQDYEYIFNHAELTMCFVANEEILAKVNAIKDKVPTLKHIYTYDKIKGAKHWSEILDLGKEGDQAKVDAIKESVKETDLATLIYTSGTTGVPKGVMLSHKNLASNAIATVDRSPVVPGDIALSFLPICHVYERMTIYFYQMQGVSVHYAESIDTIGANIKEVKPHCITAVPRVIEKVYESIIAKGNALEGIKKSLFFWALKIGEQYEVNDANGAFYNFKLGIARKLIFSKWKEGLGGNLKIIASGSAALQPRLARIFCAAQIPVMEGYGLSETSPAVTLNCEGNDGLRFGTTGRVLKDVKVKIAEDGEILIKGPNLMMGYFKDDALTKEAIDNEGWFHSGDIGHLEEGQYLKITDRKKSMFKTSGGKYIAPQQMENKYKQSQFIEQMIVIGENQKHTAALIVPAFDYVKNWCKIKGITVADNTELVKNEKVVARIEKEMATYNKEFGKWEQVKKFELIDHDWLIIDDLVTPTLKLKRKNIMIKYADLVTKIYG